MTGNLGTVAHGATVQQAAQMMRARDVGILAVMDGAITASVVTDRDITVRACADGLDPTRTPLRSAMTPGVASCEEEINIIPDAAKLMEELRVRRLLVVDRNERPVGILSLGDLALRSGDHGLGGRVMAGVCSPTSAASRGL